MAKTLKKTILSSTDNLLIVREFVSDAARDFGFSEDETSKIALAVDEACTNIIKHAYKNQPDKTIQVVIFREPNTFEISIVDEGQTFDADAIKPLNLKDHLSHYRRGGLGVYLMRTLMDKVEYHAISKNKNEVRLTKFLQPARSDARR
jgi:serine/threonine-protein kinase RsbW